jgi:hypothetical protein
MIRLGLLTFLALFGFTSAVFSASYDPVQLSCHGPQRQGGFVICTIPQGTPGYYRVRSSSGAIASLAVEHPALIPFSRNSTLALTLTVKPVSRFAQPEVHGLTLHLTKGEWAIERIDGLPPGKVTPRTLEQQRKVEADWKKKQAAWTHRAAAAWYANGFRKPVSATRISGVYGSQRILNGKPKSPHLGLDFAAPEGTDIHAPATAIVVLAEPDMYFEGGLLVLDHGDGVMSVMLHLSRLDVKVGDQVEQGAIVGAVGMTGRATGPHLHWGIKVRGTYIDPALALAYQPVP